MAHRRILAGGLAIASLALMPAVAAGQTAEATTVTSDDGLVSLKIPAGAVPDGTTVEVLLRPADEAPAEMDLNGPSFYEITPTDVVFAEPVTVTRRIMLADVGVDPTDLGLPVSVTAIRDGEGAWRWLDNQLERYEYGGPDVVLVYETDTGGQLFSMIGGALTLAPDEGMTRPAGGLFRFEAILSVHPDSEATSTATSASTNEFEILEPAEVYDFDLGGSTANAHEYQCLAPGSSHFDANYSITALSDTNPLAAAVGLEGTDLLVHVHGDVTCTAT